MTNRVIAVGDIHGSYRAFSQMLDAIQPTQADTIVVLGDCVDRGPASCQVIEALLDLRERCHLVTLLGNHEEMMLDHMDGKQPRFDWLPFGGAATLKSYESSGGPPSTMPEHLEFVRTWGNYYEIESHFFVHGGYNHREPLAAQDWRRWRWHSLRTFVPAPHESGKTAVMGHTALKDARILDLGHVICIDTYCWGGGWLTALDVSSGTLWQVDREGRRNTELNHVLR